MERTSASFALLVRHVCEKRSQFQRRDNQLINVRVGGNCEHVIFEQATRIMMPEKCQQRCGVEACGTKMPPTRVPLAMTVLSSQVKSV
jgi:hypothetical protein